MKITLLLVFVIISLTDAIPYGLGRPSREILQAANSVDIDEAAPEAQAAALSDWFGFSSSSSGDTYEIAAVEGENSTARNVMNDTEVTRMTTTTMVPTTGKKEMDKKFLREETTTVAPSSTILSLMTSTHVTMKPSTSKTPLTTVPPPPTNRATTLRTTAEPTYSDLDMMFGDLTMLESNATKESSIAAPLTSTTSAPSSTTQLPTKSTSTMMPSSEAGNLSNVTAAPQMGDGEVQPSSSMTLATGSLLYVVLAIYFCL